MPIYSLRDHRPAAVRIAQGDHRGRVHGKVAVVDGARAFVTSANLTGHALKKNMEAGLKG
jgi:phosphatidylserine/phosphatidylglycerophosphate/cardiolipin synthase-like enzyme